MLDVRLISILPQQAGQGVPPAGTISQGSSSNAPVIAINLPAGSILSGFIINRDALGNPVLRTESGDITFQTNLFLRIGAEVVLRIGNRGGAPTANIVSIDGQPPPVAATAQPSFAATPEVVVAPTAKSQAAPAAPQTPPVTTAPPQTADSVSGLLLPKTSAEAATPLSFRIVTLTLPPQTPPANAPVQVAQAAPSSPPPAGASATTAPPGPTTTPLPPAIAATSVPAPQQPITFTPGQTVVAHVVRQETGNETLVQTPVGIVRLQNITLPQGSRVTLEVLPQATTAAQQPVASLLPAPLPELARQWTSLQQIASLLAVRPDAAPLPWSPLTQPAQPADATPAPQQLSSGLMFFVAALRGGDFRNWLGESNVRWLQQNGHDGLVKKAEAEFFTLARAFTDVPVSQHWQSVFFPVAVDGQLQQVRLFLKRDRKQGRNEQGKKEDDTRFIVEVSMSQLGELQMDGFVRRQPEHQVEFDLYVRSLVPLEPQVQQDIVAIYNSVGELTGYRGSLVFQAVKEFPVNPMKEAMEATGGVVA